MYIAPPSAIISLSGNTTKLHTRDSFYFICKVHSFVSGGQLQFLEILANGSGRQIPLNMIEDIMPFVNTYEISHPTRVIKIRIMDSFLVKIVCVAPIWNSPHEWINASMEVVVRESQPPTIRTEDTTKKFRVNGLNQFILCEVSGFPESEIIWRRDGEIVQDHLHEVDNVISRILYFPIFNESMAGEYVCSAHNVAGNASQSFDVKTEEPTDESISTWTWIALGLGFLLILIIIPAVILIRRLKAVQWAIRQLSEEEVEEFFNGTLGVGGEINEENPMHFPFDTSFEIPKEKMIIDKNKILGIGQFGVVYKGRLETSSQNIAFKTAQQDLTGAAFRASLAELKIMIYIGQHSNVVKLFGAYVAEIRRGILYIAMEFCDLGSLESFLRNNTSAFGNRQNGDDVELETMYGTTQLWNWAYQIATGMEYLANRKVIHSDLATRNVLLTKDRIAKITDFGLSRKLYERTDYIKSTKEPLPWRYLAVESLCHMTFSTQSDVWAFGITLWEIFSLGEVPYPGITWCLEFNRQLEMGLRNLRPSLSSDELYTVMTDCWQLDPSKRPSFGQLRDLLSKNKPTSDHDERNERDENEECEEYTDLGFQLAVTT